MKKIGWGMILLVILLAGCASSNKAVETIPLDQAIQAAAETIENNLQAGQKIALLNFTSPTVEFSAYVLEELSSILVTGKRLVVVDRRELDIIRQEENFQMSGEVSDSSAQAIGQKLGAEFIVSGSLTAIGNTYRFRIRVLSVETAAVEAAPAYELYAREGRIVSLLGRAKPVSANAQQSTVPSAESDKTYNIGDTGPAGGIIFHDKGVFSNGWQYLEAAPHDIGPTQWGAYDTDVSGTSTETGKGKDNTKIIVAELERLGEIDKAAQLCIAMDINGYKDWFLPSMEELKLMYQNLIQKGLGNFSVNKFYWSSSQYSKQRSWSSSFLEGHRKNETFSVRAVRAF